MGSNSGLLIISQLFAGVYIYSCNRVEFRFIDNFSVIWCQGDLKAGHSIFEISILTLYFSLADHANQDSDSFRHHDNIL